MNLLRWTRGWAGFGLLVAFVFVVSLVADDAAPAAAGSLALDGGGALAGLAFAGLVVNQANLAIVFQGFKTAFQRGLGQAEPQSELIRTNVMSTTREEKYGWLGKIPRFREWLGDRVVHSLMQYDYAIKNRKFEVTLEVERDDIEDDQFGVYGPLFEELGMSTAAHPEELIWPLLKEGFDATHGLAYDGQFFFDTDHPVLDAAGIAQSTANTDGGSGTPWFLADLRRPVKPVIWQTRRAYDLKRQDRPNDPNVFERDSYLYGVDARVNAGYGLWQIIWGSKQTLNKTNYKTGFAAIEGMTGDYAKPLGLKPTHLIVPPTLREAGLEIVNAERDSAGATNVWRGTAELVVVPWLA